MSQTNEHSIQPQWCLVGNIVNTGRADASEFNHRGTKHFSYGTKVYCMPPHWGDGYEKIVVIGRHRGSRQLVAMVIPSSAVSNWRLQLVYSPSALALITQQRCQWYSKEAMEQMLRSLLENEGGGQTNENSISVSQSGGALVRRE